MPKGTALKDKVLVDAQDLSNYARAVVFSSEHERIDVSGFSATGANEYISGPTEQSVTVTFYGAYGAAETHAILSAIHKNRTTVVFTWYPDSTAVVSATNPKLSGNVQLMTYGSPNRTRGESETWDAVFTTVDAAGLQFSTVP